MASNHRLANILSNQLISCCEMMWQVGTKHTIPYHRTDMARGHSQTPHQHCYWISNPKKFNIKLEKMSNSS